MKFHRRDFPLAGSHAGPLLVHISKVLSHLCSYSVQSHLPPRHFYMNAFEAGNLQLRSRMNNTPLIAGGFAENIQGAGFQSLHRTSSLHLWIPNSPYTLQR